MRRAIILRGSNGRFTSIYPLPSLTACMVATTVTVVAWYSAKYAWQKLKQRSIDNATSEIADEIPTTEVNNNIAPTVVSLAQEQAKH